MSITTVLSLAIVLCGISTVRVCAVPLQDKPVYTVTVRGNATPGYYLLGPSRSGSIGLVDHGGYLAHARPAENFINFQRHSNGKFSFYQAPIGYIILDSMMNPIDTVTIVGGSTDFHAFEITRDGSYLVLGVSIRVVDLSLIVPGGHPKANVIDALIDEISPDGKLLFRWNSKDHVAITDATADINLRMPAVDYIHVNSFLEDDDRNIVISARHFDQLIKIDRSTGDILWRLGGSTSKSNDFTWLNDTISGFVGFSKQHAISRTSADRLLMMDNGSNRPVPFSRAVEYEIDEINKTVETVWQYRHPTNVYADKMGSAARLNTGGTLIGWGDNPLGLILTELDANDSTVFEVVRAQDSTGFSYQVMKFPVFMRYGSDTISVPRILTFQPGTIQSPGVTMNVTSVSGVRTVNVELHDYPSWNATFANDDTIDLLPYRWTVRSNMLPSDESSLTLDLSVVQQVDLSRAVMVYRPLDGRGEFSRVPTTIDIDSGVMTVHTLLNGEIAVGYPKIRVSVQEPGVDNVWSPNQFVNGMYSMLEVCDVVTIFDVQGRVILSTFKGQGLSIERLHSMDIPRGLYYILGQRSNGALHTTAAVFMGR